MSDVSSGTPLSERDPYAPFRPRWGARISRVMALVVLVPFTYAAIVVPGQDSQKGDWTLADRLLIFLTGVGIAYFLHRYATIRAVPTRDGLAIRNILRSRTVSWAEIVRLQFGGGSPWATVDLADTDQVAIMAIQRVDGPYADAEASRLAALIHVHGEARGYDLEGDPHPEGAGSGYEDLPRSRDDEGHDYI